ncbi:hypothetical protein CR513_58042, partial [Mucuna pruriens]
MSYILKYPNAEWDEFQGLEGSRSNSTGLLDLDLVLRVEEPIPTMDNLQEMSNLAAKLKSLKLESGEDLIVHLVLILLLTHFG